MNKLFFILSILILSFGLSSCFSDVDNYYVKYTAIVDVDGYASISEVVEAQYTFMTDTGQETVNLNRRTSWSGTYGPVKKGFVANLSGTAVVKNANVAPMTLSIYVCRGDEPFAMKAQQVSKRELENHQVSTSVSYTIE